jgi:hypothetical protein
MRVPYALRRVPAAALASLLPPAEQPCQGTLAVARLEKLGKNTGLELPTGRRCALHEGDILAVVFGNRYATEQFEGYAGVNGDRCDLLSMGGLCGLARSKNSAVPDPTRLRLLGLLVDEDGRPLQLQDFALPARPVTGRPSVLVVCGSAMEAGKTHTAVSLVIGLRRQRQRVAAVKLTGTACGRDSWSVLDAGASPVLNFVDGGYVSTYMCGADQLLDLHRLLLGHATDGAEWVVVEIADGLLQPETSVLLQSSQFVATVDGWFFATGDPVAATGGVTTLRRWGIEPTAITGLITRSPLAMQEAHAATAVPCWTANELQQGKWAARFQPCEQS